MRQRAKSALIMAPLLVIVLLGGYFLIAGVIVLTVLALREFMSAFGEKKPAGWVFWASLAVLYGGFLFLAIRMSIIAYNNTALVLDYDYYRVVLPIWVFVSVTLCLLSMFAMEKRDLIHGIASFVGVFYIIFFAFHLILVDFGPLAPVSIGAFQMSGLHTYVWIVFMSAFGTDIFAYLVGKAIGKRKLCPSISPKKTVAGSIGGVIGSVILCGLFSWFFLPSEFWTCIVIGVAGGIFSQFGDLAASVMKRKIGIKDWGTLIPGHGGVLDRIDSVLFVAPLVYYILMLRMFFFGM